MDTKKQWKEGVGGKSGIVGMQDCTSLRHSNYPMGRWFLLMRRLTFSCNPIPSNAMWCVWLASATALRGHKPLRPFARSLQHPENCLFYLCLPPFFSFFCLSVSFSCLSCSPCLGQWCLLSIRGGCTLSILLGDKTHWQVTLKGKL